MENDLTKLDSRVSQLEYMMGNHKHLGFDNTQNLTFGGGEAQQQIAVEDEGTLIANNPSILNFTGSLVSVSAVGQDVTIDITSGTSQPKSVTFVVGPSSNSDSSTYNYITDGTNDDVEIQAAIDALPSTGGEVRLREGTYTLGSASVVIAKNGVTLSGVGKGTIVTCKATFNKQFINLGHSANQYSNCTIRDIYFDGNKANQSSGADKAIIDNDTLGFSINNVEILDCFFINAYAQCISNQSSGVSTHFMLIQNNYFADWTGTTGGSRNCCIYLMNANGQRSLVINNFFTNTSTTAGFIIGNTSFDNVVNNTFKAPNSYNATIISSINVVTDNLFLVGTSAGSSCVAINNSASLVKGNYILFDSSANVASCGIQTSSIIANNDISGCGRAIIADRQCQIMGNRVTANRGHSIYLTGGSSVSPVIVNNNYLGGGGNSADATYSLIYIDNSCPTNIISGNTLVTGSATNYPLYGIYENSSGYNNIIIGNYLVGTGTGLSIQSPTTDDSHNIIP